MAANDVEHEEEQDPVAEKERLAVEKKQRDYEKVRLKKERQAVEREKKSKVDAIAAEEAAKVAALAAAEQAIVDAKAAAVAEIEAQRIAKIAANKKKREKKTDDVDDLALLESTIAANESLSDKTATTAQAANRAPMDAEKSAKLLEAFKVKKKQLAKGVKKGKEDPFAAEPSAEQKAYEARVATAAAMTKEQNMEKERQGVARRAEEKAAAARAKEIESNKSKPQAITAPPVDRTIHRPAPVRDAAKMLSSLELEIGSLESSVASMAQAVVLDRVTELMIKLDDVPVSSTEHRACRKSAIVRLNAISAGAS